MCKEKAVNLDLQKWDYEKVRLLYLPVNLLQQS